MKRDLYLITTKSFSPLHYQLRCLAVSYIAEEEQVHVLVAQQPRDRHYFISNLPDRRHTPHQNSSMLAEVFDLGDSSRVNSNFYLLLLWEGQTSDLNHH